MAPRRKNAEIHHVDFMKLNRRWVALIYIDPNTSVSQQTVGTKKNVDHIIKTQLDPHGIPYTIEGMTEMTNYPTYMVKAGLVPNSRHGSYPGDTGKIPKTKAAFKKEYFDLLTKYFSTRQYIGAGKYEKPTAKSLRIADRLAELQDAHPDWAFETDDEWGDDQRMNHNPRRKKSNPNDGLLKYQVWITKEGRGWVVHQLDNWDDFAEVSETYFTAKARAMAYKRQQEKLTVGGRNEGHLNPKRRRNSRVLWRRNKWRIEWYDPQAKWRGFYVVGENHAEHPTVYFDGSIAYDRPEAVPKYVQKAVAQLAQKYESQMDGYNNPKRSNPKRRKNAKSSRSNLVFFMETRGGKYNVKVYKVGKKYKVVIHERGVADQTGETTSKAEVRAVVGQFHKVGYMTGTAKYKVKHDSLGLGIE